MTDRSHWMPMIHPLSADAPPPADRRWLGQCDRGAHPRTGAGYSLLAALLLAAMPALGGESSYDLEWDAVDDARVTNYRVYYGYAPGEYEGSIDVGNRTSYTIAGLDPDTVYYFSVKATDDAGQESDFSNELTSAPYRYLFGLGDFPPDGGWIDVADINQGVEQTVAVGWKEYNALNGEARLAAGDIDGDGRDEVIIGFDSVVDDGIDGGYFQLLDDDFSPLAWGRLDWREYNALNGETRPAAGDIDGDGVDEILIGLGPGGEGAMAVFSYANGSLESKGWTAIDWAEYNAANGETRPALGDIDGDGRDELVVGLGEVDGREDLPGGQFIVKDQVQVGQRESDTLTAVSAHGGRFIPAPAQIIGTLSWSDYARQEGETRPAIGDLDGDGRAELVMGLGESGGGNFELFHFQNNALVSLAWQSSRREGSSATDTRPAVGDLDNDGKSEIVVGFGSGGDAQVELFGDASQRFAKTADWQVVTDDYRDSNGELWPVIKRER